jgi:hypothetical protein
MTADEALLTAALDEIEQREARLLTWGLVDGFLTVGEAAGLVDALLDDPHFADPGYTSPLSFLSAADVLAALQARALVLDVSDGGEPRYRSRMAEAVRLLFRLRQLFPKHQGPTGWQSAPTLVADFRFLWRRRRYPDRCLTPADILAQLRSALADVSAREALAELIGSHGPAFRLARFQLEASRRILGGLGAERSQATLVSAGTGSGKTLAFYLPALTRIATHIVRDPTTSRWVKALALYPRNELLKDQFVEVYGEARRLDGWLHAHGRRKILIAALFGFTPYDAAAAPQTKGWRARGGGLVCEYIRCPTDGCAGDMFWPDEDRGAGRERLVCGSCRRAIDSDEVILTRVRLQRESPDILFTTTEMLNQRMADSGLRHLFGLGRRCERPVELMLLDEVHTFVGATGAQVAYLLRRWRRLLRTPVSFVGLSATLRDGARFFARLTGLNEQVSVEVTPAGGDLISEGAEYLLALRGDPVSRTALLSTTIQTAMLLARMMDPPGSQKSGGLVGERQFLFTDNIDVTNRVYFAMLDAEGRNSWGNIDNQRHPNGGLVTLRAPMPNRLRKLHGQDWEATVEVGHTLQANDRKSVGRVMALDPGVGSGLDIIVATAALEVGFNDPKVGAVIQHKAPRDVAQFLQRKGRAGRSRQMRPWTVVVLSDYGRDRVAYQAYDLLFDPELPVRALPIGNRYVERIQAVYATIDYLGLRLAGVGEGSVWTNLTGPGPNTNQRSRQTALARLIDEILTNPSERDSYAAFLSRALDLPDAEVAALLWEDPRPLMLEVLPTARRRLETQWRDAKGGEERHVRNSPLPEFAPANLFSDLNLPEVAIALPAVGGATPDLELMPIAQALREYAPGRVSRRYGLSHAYERHWLCVTLDAAPVQAVPLEGLVEGQALGDWRIDGDAEPLTIPVLRPHALHVQPTPPAILDTSNARLRWRTQIIGRTPGLVLEPPQGSPWTPLVIDVRFHTHQGLSPVEVRRLALGSEAGLRFRDGSTTNKRFDFEQDGRPAALGFSLSVDAFCLRVRFPEALWPDLANGAEPRRSALRTARFHDLARQGPHLSMVDNTFARAWLAHLLLAALSNEAIAKEISLEAAADNLAQGRADLTLEQTLDILFQSAVVDDVDGQTNQQDKLRQDLAHLVGDAAVRAGLLRLAAVLWAPMTVDWEPWLRDRFTATVAAAAHQALLNLCPELDADSLVVDLYAGPREADDQLAGEASAEVWISELAPGGNGHIEEALRQYAEDPRRYFGLMTAALRDNDFALSDHQLQRFLETAVETAPDGELADAAADLRRAEGVEATHRSLVALRRTLAADGFVTFHSFMVALTNRVLRPGSTSESDAFFLSALREWTAQEERLGIELDARVIAYRLSRRPDIDAALNFAGIDTPTVNPDQWRMGVVYGLLWPRGAEVRQSGLQLYSPFVDLPPPEPLLLRPYLEAGHDPIDLRDADWRERCLARLAETGAATLVCPVQDAEPLAQAFNFLATNPVQTGYLSVFARVQAARRVQDQHLIEVDIPEALQ